MFERNYYGFGPILKDYLDYHRISQSDFAKRLGITQKHMNEIVNNKAEISVELMLAINLITDIDVELIWQAEEEKRIYLYLKQNFRDEKELKEYMEHLELIGEGGTDFRPAFEYVNHLIEQGEFYHLKGLIYFTDGKGTYPKKKPPYQTAFIFMQEEYEDVDVPPWAVKLIVDAEDLDEGEEKHEY